MSISIKLIPNQTPNPIIIGKLSEYGETINVDLSAYISEYGSGSADATFTPNGGETYLLNTEMSDDGTVMSVSVTSTETVTAGRHTMTVNFYTNSEHKEQDIKCIVLSSAQQTESPDSVKTWMQNAEETLEEVDTALEELGDVSEIKEELSSVKSELTAETTARESADATLQKNIDAEATSRKSSNATLQDNIDAETERAENAETALNSAVTAETTARREADNLKADKADTYTKAEVDSLATDIQAQVSQNKTELSNFNIANIVTLGADTTGTVSITSVLQKAFDGTYDAIYFPAGTYLLGGKVTLSRNNVTIFGEGERNTTIKYSSSSSRITLGNGSERISGINIHDLHFDCSVSNATGVAMEIISANYIKIRNVLFDGSLPKLQLVDVQDAYINETSFCQCGNLDSTIVAYESGTGDYASALSRAKYYSEVRIYTNSSNPSNEITFTNCRWEMFRGRALYFLRSTGDSNLIGPNGIRFINPKIESSKAIANVIEILSGFKHIHFLSGYIFVTDAFKESVFYIRPNTDSYDLNISGLVILDDKDAAENTMEYNWMSFVRNDSSSSQPAGLYDSYISVSLSEAQKNRFAEGYGFFGGTNICKTTIFRNGNKFSVIPNSTERTIIKDVFGDDNIPDSAMGTWEYGDCIPSYDLVKARCYICSASGTPGTWITA